MASERRSSYPGVSVRLGSLLGLLALAPLAHASERTVAERIASVDADTRSLYSQVEDLQRNFTDRKGLIGVTDARDRYQEGVYQYLVGDYGNAATTFYILVQSRALASDDLAHDSEWYLAECLFELADYRIALEAYQGIIDAGGTHHPYFADAVRRSLETNALLKDGAAFDKLYADYITSGKVATTDLISYTLAKSFYRRGESARAKSMFESIAPATPYYSRARYFLGVLMIEEKNYKQAITEFSNSEKDPVVDDEHKRVHELAQVALARMNYEAGDMEEAVFWYGKVSRNSPNYADQLYESAWADIKTANDVETEVQADFVADGGDPKAKAPVNQKLVNSWRTASETVALFLEGFPQHRYTASMKILQGHLHMKLQDFDGAEQGYQKVVAEYEPVVERLGQIQADRSVTGRFLDQLTDDRRGATEDLLPGYAEEILLSRPEVGRAASSWNDLRHQREELKESDELIALLQTVMAGKGRRLGSFVTASSQLDAVAGNVLSLQGRLIDAELAALRVAVPARRPELAAIQKQRDSAYPDAAAAPDINTAVAATFVNVRQKLAAFRGEVVDASQLVAIDQQWASVQALNAQVGLTVGVLAAAESRELEAVREKLEATRERVVELHADVSTQSANVESLAEIAVQSGVHAVESDFRTDVLTADKGIVDVAWLRKTSTTEQMETLSKEQVALLKRIKEQYDQLRRNASDGENSK